MKSNRRKNEPDYVILYEIVERNREKTLSFYRSEFLKIRPGASFETTIKYLFELLLESMLELRKDQDSYYNLFDKIFKARILYEKSLFGECFEMLNYVIVHSEKYENYHALLLASRLELEYLLALNSYIELNNLFEANKHLWNDRPVYYLHTLEGVLESLRSIHNYEGMAYFINQLKVMETQSADFRINLTCITFLYELFPFLDRGDFTSSMALMNQYKDKLFDKLFTLSRARQAELCLYTSLIYFGNSEYNKAHKFLNQIILRGKNYYYLPLYRTIRLVNLIILYKLGDFDLIRYEIRSMKRDITDAMKDYKIERFLFKFLSKQLPSVALKRQLLLEKTLKEFSEIHQDVFEKQILRIFDFTAWAESLIRKIPLSEVLYLRIHADNSQETHDLT